MDKCSSCQSTRLEEAVIASAGVQPARAGRIAKALAAAELRGRVCLECGQVDRLRADPKQLRKMLGEK